MPIYNSNSAKKNEKINLYQHRFALFVNVAFASVKTEIEKANKSGNCMFLMITETGNNACCPVVTYPTAEENVMVAISLLQKDRRQQKTISRELLAIVRLSDRMQHYPKELSSGQEQRVAIARALANNPAIILVDGPTGNLDLSLASEILLFVKRIK